MRKEDTIPFDWTDERDKDYLAELVRDFLSDKLGIEPESFGYTITVNWEEGQ